MTHDLVPRPPDGPLALPEEPFPKYQVAHLRRLLENARAWNDELEAELADRDRIIKQLRALIRPEDLNQCAGRRYQDGERCQRPALLDGLYCARHAGTREAGRKRRARIKAQREAAGWW